MADTSRAERIHKYIHRFFGGSMIIVGALQKLQAVDFTKYVPSDIAAGIVGAIGITVVLLEFAGPLVTYFETAD